MGAWIEILPLSRCVIARPVAPHMGAWIEMLLTEHFRGLYEVAPHMGAWIEIISIHSSMPHPYMSHPTWVRGLKYCF